MLISNLLMPGFIFAFVSELRTDYFPPFFNLIIVIVIANNCGTLRLEVL